MKSRFLVWVANATMALALGACAGVDLENISVSVPGAYGPLTQIAAKGAGKVIQAARPISDSEEYYVGRAVAARILSTYALCPDPRLTLYVNQVGQAVARKSSRPVTYRGYHFAVLDAAEPNAFACPGGMIFVTLGLLRTCQSEDELAAVLAHEVAHVAHKDGIGSISQSRWTEVLTAMGGEAARQYGGVPRGLVTLFEGAIEDVFKTIVVNGYSRSAEEAADAAAQVTLAEAGYNPSALSTLLFKMSTLNQRTGGIFTTHPPTSDRLAKVGGYAGPGQPTDIEMTRVKRFRDQGL